MGENRNEFGVLVGKPEGKGILGRHGRRWEDNIEINLRGTGWVLRSGFIWLKIGPNGGLL
jgi:hypothetical protein